MNTYGQFQEGEQYPLEARIWGHRLRDGQHWMEYLLEFLSVLAGYDYVFGRGNRSDQKYRIPKRLGLRRFVFYDEREKTQDPRDQQATKLLVTALEQKVTPGKSTTNTEIIRQVQVLLRSFSVIEDNRSWYAKSLFPVHENLLLWEALRKGSTKTTYRGTVHYLSAADLDEGIEFNARNFFARGGELYYLMISAGTERSPERRARISQRLRTLLTEQNKTLGELASLIDQTWQDQKQVSADYAQSSPGWIPDPDCELYQQFAEDLDTLLDNSLDPLECLELLAHLICMHIIVYIYYRAHPHQGTVYQPDASRNPHRPEILIDIPGDEESGVIRSLSASQLKQHEQWQIERVKRLIRARVEDIATRSSDERFLETIREEASNYFGGTRRKSREQFEREIQRLKTYMAHHGQAQVNEQVIGVLYDVMGRNFRDHFIGIHRRLGRSIGLIAPSRGPQPRFVLGDTLLKTLTMAVLPADKTMTFGQFLETLYKRYGIIIGPGEARKAQFQERYPINEGAFSRNRDRFLLRMKLAGLLTQYSDATAIVYRP